MRMMMGILCALALLAGVAHAEAKLAPVVLREDLQQGGFYVAQLPAGAKATLAGKEVFVSPRGLLVLGFDRHQPERNMLNVCVGDVCGQTTLWVKPREYVIQRVTKVPQATVTPDEKQRKRVAADNQATRAARALVVKGAGTVRADLGKGFALPVEAPTSGVYGSARSYNGEERSWHRGHDLAAKAGTPVKAPAPGIVRLARDTFMSGNLIMIDHGGGISSVYAHLSQMLVKAGQEVKAGEVIGKVGNTGRSTGPHLHWGMYWQEVPVDPILWVEKSALDRCAERKAC